MVALVQTAANVVYVSGVSPRVVRGGETGVRGNPVYLDSADNEHKLADANDTAKDAVIGVLLTDMVNGADCLIGVKGTKVNIGATTVAGIPYCAGPTAGDIVPYADLVATDTPCLLFWGSGTAEVTLVCELSPAALA